MSPSVDSPATTLTTLLRSRTRQSFRARYGDVEPVEAAVLVPLVLATDKLEVWMLKRPTSMRTHAGQIAFPGGRRDPEDPDTGWTARREAYEEVGLREEQLRMLGPFDDFTTPSGFTIYPHVALVDPLFAPTPNPAEVERVLRAPLGLFLQDPIGEFPRAGIEVEGELVWGATFLIARVLATQLQAHPQIAPLL